VIPPRLRAGLVIGAVVIASGIAGAAIDRAFLARRPPRSDGRRGGPPPEMEQRRRAQMLDKLTSELSLTPTQRAGLDSIFQRTDSTLRAIRREAQPRIQQVFERSNADINARLDSAQRAKFATLRHKRGSGEHRGGGRRGSRGDSARQ
jgi:Spy/CpxP family protein refolding chaperone